MEAPGICKKTVALVGFLAFKVMPFNIFYFYCFQFFLLKPWDKVSA